ncbi:adenylyl-sulfate kinase [Mucilaginibacter sp. Bleaf8]|uniref:adenylyl-sulfate kinase n=1 Tax=Mucilaginibacter sp. Bleaf8 TaxID=2834430 RepID=UPI001BD077B7|nr:adenylyl-sulfate kinase [Mucilaginibacter sp. Bleaf8]MBS7563860.1 adenylyl-sulfate kinase [Mucilaginibacter sp. Bleaf8]
MVTDVLLKIFDKDPLIKRNIGKTISWRIVGSIDTVLLGWLISGHFSTGAKIGLTELLTKMVLYYGHERLWQKLSWGLPSKQQRVKKVQEEIAPTLFKQIGRVNQQKREQLNHHRAFTIWLTGLSGAGKTTLAVEIEEFIYKQQGRVYILDGDNTRLGINKDLSFSAEDRSENIRRVAELCKLFNDAGIIVIASFIAPFRKDRALARAIIGEEHYTEVYLEASLAACQHRDVKGLYQKAIEGKIKNFTGISSPYEPPEKPDLHLNTEVHDVNECVTALQLLLAQKMQYVTS